MPEGSVPKRLAALPHLNKIIYSKTNNSKISL